jgi:hypothetical protein
MLGAYPTTVGTSMYNMMFDHMDMPLLIYSITIGQSCDFATFFLLYALDYYICGDLFCLYDLLEVNKLEVNKEYE